MAKVTAKEVNEVAARYFKRSNRTAGVFISVRKGGRADTQPPDVAELVNYKGGKGIASGESFETTPANIDARTKKAELPEGVKVAFLEKKLAAKR